MIRIATTECLYEDSDTVILVEESQDKLVDSSRSNQPICLEGLTIKVGIAKIFIEFEEKSRSRFFLMALSQVDKSKA